MYGLSCSNYLQHQGNISKLPEIRSVCCTGCVVVHLVQPNRGTNILLDSVDWTSSIVCTYLRLRLGQVICRLSQAKFLWMHSNEVRCSRDGESTANHRWEYDSMIGNGLVGTGRNIWHSIIEHLSRCYTASYAYLLLSRNRDRVVAWKSPPWG